MPESWQASHPNKFLSAAGGCPLRSVLLGESSKMVVDGANIAILTDEESGWAPFNQPGGKVGDTSDASLIWHLTLSLHSSAHVQRGILAECAGVRPPGAPGERGPVFPSLLRDRHVFRRPHGRPHGPEGIPQHGCGGLVFERMPAERSRPRPDARPLTCLCGHRPVRTHLRCRHVCQRLPRFPIRHGETWPRCLLSAVNPGAVHRQLQQLVSPDQPLMPPSPG